MTLPTISADPGNECGAPVGNLVTYPCRLTSGHQMSEGSPCYAPEVKSSEVHYLKWARQSEEAREEAKKRYQESQVVDPWPEEDDQYPTLDSTPIRVYSVAEGEKPPAPQDLRHGDVMYHLHDGKGCYASWHQERQDWVHYGYHPVEDATPTKTREGDQRLPDGAEDGDCVQDRVIAAMEESKRVGIERYGQTLRTFNGRRGMQDVTDEVRDLFVYLTQIQMEAEADREQLVKAVTGALVKNSALPEWMQTPALGRDMRPLAELVVDRVMGWVTAHRAVPVPDLAGNDVRYIAAMILMAVAEPEQDGTYQVEISPEVQRRAWGGGKTDTFTEHDPYGAIIFRVKPQDDR